MPNRLKGRTDDEVRAIKEALGTFLLNLPLASKALRHRNAVATLRGHYFHPNEPHEALAARFLEDLVTLDTEAMLEKWYVEGADDLLRRALPPLMRPQG